MFIIRLLIPLLGVEFGCYGSVRNSLSLSLSSLSLLNFLCNLVINVWSVGLLMALYLLFCRATGTQASVVMN